MRGADGDGPAEGRRGDGAGTLEKVVDTAPVHLRMAGWAKGALDLYPGCEHEIVMEAPAARARFFDRATALFDANRG